MPKNKNKPKLNKQKGNRVWMKWACDYADEIGVIYDDFDDIDDWGGEEDEEDYQEDEEVADDESQSEEEPDSDESEEESDSDESEEESDSDESEEESDSDESEEESEPEPELLTVLAQRVRAKFETANTDAVDLRLSLPNAMLASAPWGTIIRDLDNRIKAVEKTATEEDRGTLEGLEQEISTLQTQLTNFAPKWNESSAGFERGLNCPMLGEWDELKAQIAAGNAAVRNSDGDACKAASANIVQMVDQYDAAAPETLVLKSRLATISSNVTGTLKTISDIADPGFGKPAPQLALETVEAQIGKLTGKGMLNDNARTAASGALDILETWQAAASSELAGNQQMVKDLKAAPEHSNKKQTYKASMDVINALQDLSATSASINQAYQTMLTVKGPWTQRIQQAVTAGGILAEMTNMGYALVPATDMANRFAGTGKDVVAIFRKAGLTRATLDGLLVHVTSPAKLMFYVESFREAQLSELAAHYLPNLAVSGANFQALVAANQVNLLQGGHRNPFPYYCNNHLMPNGRNMREAEAALDVSWIHDISNVLPLWGVVHVHYHGQNITTPDGLTYYHVKANSFAASLGALGRVAAGGAIGAINGQITAGQMV